MSDLDTQISQAHAAAEATEQQARHLEARILKTVAQLPKRQYGSPLNPEALRIGDEKRRMATAQQDLRILRALMRVPISYEHRQELIAALRKDGALS